MFDLFIENFLFFSFDQQSDDNQDYDGQGFNSQPFGGSSFSNNDQFSRNDGGAKSSGRSSTNSNFRAEATTFIPIIRFDKEQTLDGSYKTRLHSLHLKKKKKKKFTNDSFTNNCIFFV